MYPNITKEVSMSPEQTAYVRSQYQKQKWLKIGGIVFFVFSIFFLLVALGVVLPAVELTAGNQIVAYVLPFIGVVFILVSHVRQASLRQDLQDRLISVLQTKLRRKEYDTEDTEYELTFEGVTGDTEVSKETYDRLVEGERYELLVSKHTRIVFAISSIETGDVYYQKSL